jgi:hypothetical protein
MTSTLLAALQTETAEFVRPALIAALAAVGQDPQVQRALLGEVGRGLDFFRSAVIDHWAGIGPSMQSMRLPRWHVSRGHCRTTPWLRWVA